MDLYGVKTFHRLNVSLRLFLPLLKQSTAIWVDFKFSLGWDVNKIDYFFFGGHY